MARLDLVEFLVVAMPRTQNVVPFTCLRGGVRHLADHARFMATQTEHRSNEVCRRSATRSTICHVDGVAGPCLRTGRITAPFGTLPTTSCMQCGRESLRLTVEAEGRALLDVEVA